MIKSYFLLLLHYFNSIIYQLWNFKRKLSIWRLKLISKNGSVFFFAEERKTEREKNEYLGWRWEWIVDLENLDMKTKKVIWKFSKRNWVYRHNLSSFWKLSICWRKTCAHSNIHPWRLTHRLVRGAHRCRVERDRRSNGDPCEGRNGAYSKASFHSRHV